MKCSAKIIIDDNPENILRLFSPETKEFQNKRAFYSIKKKDSKIELEVKATDASAMRAALNSIMKNLVVYEKVNKNG